MLDLTPRPVGRPRGCYCGACSRCRHADYMRAWYQAKTIQERRAWMALRDPELVAARERARAGTSDRYDSLKRSIARHPEKERAREALRRAVARGTVTKQPCYCGANKVEGHHPDYSKPLDVEWLCRKHHVAQHMRAAA